MCLTGEVERQTWLLSVTEAMANIVTDSSGKGKEYFVDQWRWQCQTLLLLVAATIAYIITASGGDDKEHCFG